MAKLTHFDDSGAAHMVDISDKNPSERSALAQAIVEMSPATFELIVSGQAQKGDVLGVARLAGIMGAKKTADLIPLCHPLPLTKVAISFTPVPSNAGPLGRAHIIVEAHAKTTGKTGVEMEAICAASIASLTIYDMVKSAEKGVIIKEIKLIMKEGGKSGRYEAST